MQKLHAAIVRSTLYTDLWVCDISSDPLQLFKSSLLRCPPIGFTECFDADFIIVKASDEYPCREIVYSWEESVKNSMLNARKGKNPALPFLDETYHESISMEEISHFVDDIDWSKYDIVITINACIPQRIVEKSPKVLWCYYVSENDAHLTSNKLSIYDVLLNQDVCKKGLPPFAIGMPYSFLGSQTIANLNRGLSGSDQKKMGIYVEINNTSERPVRSARPEFCAISEAVGIPLILHSQNIIENTKNLYGAKYFVKLFGRMIRGNSALEAASAGTVMIVNKDLVAFSNLIHDFCHVTDYTKVIEKIQYLEKHPAEYEKIVEWQRDAMDRLYFKKPINDLVTNYYMKTNPMFVKYLGSSS